MMPTIYEIKHNTKFPDKHILNLILQYVLSFTKEQLFLKQDFVVDEEKYKKIEKIYHNYSKNHIPIEYLLKEAEFMGKKFFVNENVLIPRPETEYLVSYVLKYHKKGQVLDVGTGSGIIGIMLSSFGFDVCCVDISEKALEVAKKNANKILENKNICFKQSNLLFDIDIVNNDELIICANLPYLTDDYKLDLLAEKEPKLALYAGKDGLDLYIKLLEQIFELKNKKITIYFELTYQQAKYLVDKYNFQNYDILDTCHKNIKILTNIFF